MTLCEWECCELVPAMKTKATIEYAGKKYEILADWGRDYPFHAADFMWREGNYSCDCNRSLFIQRQCDPSFPEMKCGDTIRLVALEAVKG